MEQIYKKHDRTFNLYITCYGEIGALQEITIKLGNSTIARSSVVEAIDTLFQLVKVFQKEFPAASVPWWQVIEKICYSLPVADLKQTVLKLSPNLGRPIPDNSFDRKRSTTDSINHKVKKKSKTNERRST